jgi:hypothetical protein
VTPPTDAAPRAVVLPSPRDRLARSRPARLEGREDPRRGPLGGAGLGDWPWRDEVRDHRQAGVRCALGDPRGVRARARHSGEPLRRDQDEAEGQPRARLHDPPRRAEASAGGDRARAPSPGARLHRAPMGRDGRPSGQRRRSPTETPERQPERGRGGSRDHRPTPKNHSRRSVPFPAMLQERMLPQCADKLPAALLFIGSGRRVPPTHPDRWQVVGSPAPCAALACRG